ncbi:MAG: nitronate monooxygenase [Gaiella sp.]|nr:nitronate monooxygenase [Gaiella sp.]
MIGHPALQTRLCDVLGVPYPIVQSAMGWVATESLAVASARAGCFPFLAAATQTAAEAERSIVHVRETVDSPFGVNFLMQQPGADAIVEAIIRHGVHAAGYSRSPEPRLIERLREHGVVCIPTVGHPRHALKAVALGADALIAQGAEGGGHTGTLVTGQLVPQIATSVDVPVVAAGGFMDGGGLISALALGAAGIAMGTRFLLTAESPVPEHVKETYLRASLDDTVVSARIDSLPQRVLRNEAARELEGAGRLTRLLRTLQNARAYRSQTDATVTDLVRILLRQANRRDGEAVATIFAANAAMLPRAALVDGDVVHGVMPAGQVVGRIKDLPTCDDLVRRIVTEAEATLVRLEIAAGSPPGR